ncbi:MAG TPA: TerC family protein [Polyangiaceae bacterium]|nr:TerC family protein [Polyangiaceae bacterium]
MHDGFLYTIFGVIVAGLLAVDLFVVQRDPKAVSMREAAIWSAVWVGCAVLFGLFVPRLHQAAGAQAVTEYFIAYVIEKSLSVDNVFVFIIIFSTFAVPAALQHRVLFYGVLGAIAMRAALVFAGAALIERFSWLLYVFGAFLLYVAYRTWQHREEREEFEGSSILRFVRRAVPSTDDYEGKAFFVRKNGKILATKLFLVLALVELTDLLFAVDSIPAVFAVTRDPFIVLTSNVFAILGLRALYFLLAGVSSRLHYLKAGLAVILAFVGLKMLTENIEGLWHPPPLASLGFVGAVLLVVAVTSYRRGPEPAEKVPAGVTIFPRRSQPKLPPPDPEPRPSRS